MHGEYKIPGGKLIVVDLDVIDGALLMQETPPMTEAWAAGCVQRLKEYALRRKRATLVAELAQPTAPATDPQNDEKLQEYWRMRVESID
jgi:hypothetical protein